MIVRSATEADAPGILAIYAPIVRDTHVSFEEAEPPVQSMAERVTAVQTFHPWLVAAGENDEILGYAYGSTFRSRPAYRWSVEVSAYVADGTRGRGVGRALYTELLAQLTRRGFVTALAGIALPNDASVAFHESFGFEHLGVYRNVGFKFDRWWDVGWWQRTLPAGGAPETPTEVR